MKETENNAIQSITTEDIYDTLSDTVGKVFEDQMSMLLKYTSNVKSKSMIIFYTEKIESNCDSIGLLKLVEKWAIKYNQKQRNSYNLIGYYRHYIFHLISEEGIYKLVQNQIQEFYESRDPVILSKDTTTEQSECSSRPISFINIGRFTKL